MKNKTAEERKAEVRRAKESMQAWMCQGRNWDYIDICAQFPHKPCQLALLEMLETRGYFVVNAPNVSNLVHDQDQTSAVASPAESPSSSSDTGPRDPIWQK